MLTSFDSRMTTVLFSLFLLSGNWQTPVDQPFFLVNESFRSNSLLPYSNVLMVEDSLTAEEAAREFERGKGVVPAKSTMGYTDQFVWLQTSIGNGTRDTRELYLELGNPHIDYVHVFDVTGEEVESLAETGDQFDFYQRPVMHRNFVFPLRFEPGEKKTILLLLEKRGSAMDIPLFLWTARALADRDYRYNLGYGAFFGFLFICFVFAVLTYFSVRKQVYFWYAAYIFSLFIYTFSNVGLAFQYIYPWARDVNSLVHVSFSVIIFVCFSKFSQRFLPIAERLPRINRALDFISYFFIFFICLGAITYPGIKSYSLYLLPVSYSLLMIGHALVVGSAFYLARQHKRDAGYFLVGIFIMGILGSLQILRPHGLTILPTSDLNLVMVGVSVEIFLFTIALTLQVRKISEERNILSLKISHQQKELLKAYVDGVEKERERIARELHDDIGSRLGSLQRFFTSQASNVDVQKQINILCDDVRTMSHQLSPTSLKISGLRQMILDLAEEMQQQNKLKVHVQFYDVPESLPEETSHHLYRIVQEGINNVAKHADATEVDIQLFNHAGELVVTLDDNGKGFDTMVAKKGIGLKNMRARVESLGGTLEISSDVGQGTSILIKQVFVRPLQ